VRGNLYDEGNGLANAHWTGPSYIWEINEKRKQVGEQVEGTQPAPIDFPF
jgi:hypothetical protein